MPDAHVQGPRGGGEAQPARLAVLEHLDEQVVGSGDHDVPEAPVVLNRLAEDEPARLHPADQRVEIVGLDSK